MIKVTFAVLLFSLVPSQAFACMAEPTGQALIYAASPTDVPNGAVIVKAKLIFTPKSTWSSELLVLDGPSRLSGQKIWVTPRFLSSCVSLGRKVGYLAITPDKNAKDKTAYLGEVYNRSWFDHMIDWFGADPYFYSGSRAESLHD